MKKPFSFQPYLGLNKNHRGNSNILKFDMKMIFQKRIKCKRCNIPCYPAVPIEEYQIFLRLSLSKDASFLHTTILTMCTAKKVNLKLEAKGTLEM
jgi:hypothetical protein